MLKVSIKKLFYKLPSKFKMDCIKNLRSNAQQQTKLDNLNFDNKVLRSLPIDREEENYIRTVRNAVGLF